MNANQPLKRMIVGALLSGGVALAGLGLTAGTAGAARRSTTQISACPWSSASSASAPFPATVLCASTLDPSWAAARYAWPSPPPATERHGNTVRPATGSLVAGRTSTAAPSF